LAHGVPPTSHRKPVMTPFFGPLELTIERPTALAQAADDVRVAQDLLAVIRPVHAAGAGSK
jgi:hypothetical protein